MALRIATHTLNLCLIISTFSIFLFVDHCAAAALAPSSAAERSSAGIASPLTLNWFAGNDSGLRKPALRLADSGNSKPAKQGKTKGETLNDASTNTGQGDGLKQSVPQDGDGDTAVKTAKTTKDKSGPEKADKAKKDKNQTESKTEKQQKKAEKNQAKIEKEQVKAEKEQAKLEKQQAKIENEKAKALKKQAKIEKEQAKLAEKLKRQEERQNDPDKVKKAKKRKSEAVSGATAAMTETGQAIVSQIGEVEKSYASAFAAAAFSSVVNHTFDNGLSVFTVSGVSHLDHDGLSVRSSSGTEKTLGFQATTYGVTTGVRFDASHLFGLDEGTAVTGVFGNYSQSEVEIGPGFTGDIDSYAAGGYALVQQGPLYFLGLGARSWADSNGRIDDDTTGDISTQGYVASLSSGYLVSITPTVKADFRGTLTYAEGWSKDFTNGGSLDVRDAGTSTFSGSMSLKLLSTYRFEGVQLRPFVQGGITEMFDYDSTVSVDTEMFRFEQDPTSYFARAGIDIDTTFVTSFVAVKGEIADDRESIAGQIGFTFVLD